MQPDILGSAGPYADAAADAIASAARPSIPPHAIQPLILLLRQNVQAAFLSGYSAGYVTGVRDKEAEVG